MFSPPPQNKKFSLVFIFTVNQPDPHGMKYLYDHFNQK